MKARVTGDERQATWDRAFGHMKKKVHDSEWYVHKTVATYLRDNYPEVRFYSTLDGFNLGNQRSLVRALQWFEPGVPDLFVYAARGGYSMLVLELKKEGKRLSSKDEHTQRQQSWLDYLRSEGACADFSIGVDQTIDKIEAYLNPKRYGKAKRK